MEQNDALPQATVDPEPPASPPRHASASPVGEKMAPVRRQIVRAVPRPAEIVKRQATVSYFRKMRKGRLCAMTVSLADAGGKDDPPATREGTITIEPVIPGAVVYPSHADVSTQPGSEARFSVLPLCKGKLRTSRIDFRTRGKSAARMQLPVKVIRRRLARLMLLFSLVFTGLLAWDRHISHFEPFFVERIQEQSAAVPPAQERRPPGEPGTPITPGPGRTTSMPPEGARQPPFPTVEPKPPKELPLYGEKAIDGWIAFHASRSSANCETSNCEVTDLAILGMDAVHSWKFGGGLMDEKEGSIFTWAYRGWAILCNLPMSEVYVGALLFGLTAVVWFLQGPARSRRRGPVFEVSIP